MADQIVLIDIFLRFIVMQINSFQYLRKFDSSVYAVNRNHLVTTKIYWGGSGELTLGKGKKIPLYSKFGKISIVLIKTFE